MIDTMTIHRGLCQCDSGCDKGCKFFEELAAEKPTCDCQVCASGQAVNVQEWRSMDPRHEQIYQAMVAGVRNGTLKVQGETK